MVKYKVELSDQAQRLLGKMMTKDIQLYRRILCVLEGFKDDPYMGKSLKGNLKGRYSHRVGKYRILYCIKKKMLIVHVIDIGHRRYIYK